MRLTALSRAAGCAAKLGMDDLDDLLASTFGRELAGIPVMPGVATSTGEGAHGSTFETSPDPDLHPGPGAGDDLGIGDDGAVITTATRRIVATTDFFTPIVDDAHTWGHVAATNAIGDVHAMGGTPTVALMILGWPAGQHQPQLRDTLAGVRDGARADGVVVVGGHTIDAAEPFVGLAVLGDLHGHPLRQDAAQVGDRLVLTAPVGTGIVTTAARAAPPEASHPGGALHEALAAAIAVMTRSNGPVVAPARRCGVRAATDVTGFGLLGHLHRLAARSHVDVRVRAEHVGVLPGVLDLARAGEVPGGSRRNADAVVARAGVATDDLTLAVLADAQTSGGLLLACPADRCHDLVAHLVAVGHRGDVVGDVVGRGVGRITVDGTVA